MHAAIGLSATTHCSTHARYMALDSCLKARLSRAHGDCSPLPAVSVYACPACQTIPSMMLGWKWARLHDRLLSFLGDPVANGLITALPAWIVMQTSQQMYRQHVGRVQQVPDLGSLTLLPPRRCLKRRREQQRTCAGILMNKQPSCCLAAYAQDAVSLPLQALLAQSWQHRHLRSILLMRMR